MPITTADYLLTDIWTDTTDQEFYNVYYVRHTGGAQTAQGILDAFNTTMTPLIANVLHSQMENIRTEAYSLTDPLDYDTNVTSVLGTQGGEAMPNFVAVGYSVIRSSREFRNSAKRYGRVAEGDIFGNGFNPASLARFLALQDGLDDVWTNVTTSCILVMPKRVKVGSSYVLDDLAVPSGISSPVVTSQNSRKR